MYTENAATMQHYLARLVEGGDFDDVPMRADVRFTGPLASADTADAYRTICEDFAQAVRDLSETVEFVDGAFASVEVIFDAAVVTGLAS